jgi:DNA polymerase-4
MDAFFASVEQVLDPALKGKPLIIGGASGDARGVVSTASYEARKFGVHSAMPLTQARRLCPHGIYMRGHYEAYEAASDKVMEILLEASPLVECVSIDEAYVDITGSIKLFGGADAGGADAGGENAIAHHIKRRIIAETQLPCTVAIGSNKLVAKVGSDAAKPDGYLNIPTGGERGFLRPMPVRRLPGIGPRTAETLESLGLMTIGALGDIDLAILLNVFGQSAYSLQRAAQGISTSEVETESIPKSVGRETTFDRDLLDWDYVEQALIHLAERAAYALREKQMEARCVTLKVRYADFKTHTFSKTLPEPTCVDSNIIEALHALMPKAKERRARVRLIGVSLSSLLYNQHQMHLFDRKEYERWQRVFERVDQIRDKQGFDSVGLARTMKKTDRRL